MPESHFFVTDDSGKMPTMRRLASCLFFLVFSASADDGQAILALAEHYAQTQASHGSTGQVSVKAGPLDASRLPPCQALEGYTPPGARLLGRSHIGIRCLGPHPWKILVPVRISVQGDYVITARALVAGETLQGADLSLASGDLATLPAGTIQQPAEAIGKLLKNSLGAGQALRKDQLKAPYAVRQGQTVKVISQGTGFSVSAEGIAIGNGAIGDLVQVRLTNGQSIRGTVRADGTIELPN
ncbi:flagellar basal body P-ring formation chaperone FlgA [Azonexus sp. R2A61]|uniref:flagellar basal body P-ring formation chaperone FlgA n=1 Tax=Azonexus sp. R2A61 TaxID=2744443 RepID=UPI001F351135|nr:flagellar basal body P-ring formation chaperone FlgA [Azonexus sp. R2A61]